MRVDDLSGNICQGPPSIRLGRVRVIVQRVLGVRRTGGARGKIEAAGLEQVLVLMEVCTPAYGHASEQPRGGGGGQRTRPGPYPPAPVSMPMPLPLPPPTCPRACHLLPCPRPPAPRPRGRPGAPPEVIWLAFRRLEVTQDAGERVAVSMAPTSSVACSSSSGGGTRPDIASNNAGWPTAAETRIQAIDCTDAVERCVPRATPKIPVRRVEGPGSPSVLGASARSGTLENRLSRLCRLLALLDANIRRV